ncbi:MAG: T9SS type A sorting domain-containing protein [Omnitrophica WOR_2 bacterium]
MMKKLLLFTVLFIFGCNASSFAGIVMSTPDSCNAVVINDTEEQNGIFISGPQGQKAAVDIPIASDVQMTISGVKVTLSSINVPTYINLRFYNDTLSTPEDSLELPQQVPGDIMFDITDCVIDTFEVVGYEPNHQFVVRNITLTLNQPIVLNGNLVQGRYWMGVLSDAKAWATTAHYDTGAGVIGESVAMGSNTFDWFQMFNLEGLYELTAMCDVTVSNHDISVKNDISVFPNPASEFISVSDNTGKQLKKVEIFTLTGQKIREYNSNFGYLSLSGINKGLYIVRIIDNENNISNTKITLTGI